MTIHPKTSATALGTAAGTVIVGVLTSIPSVHITPELAAAIPAFLGTLGAFLAPSNGADSSSAVAQSQTTAGDPTGLGS